MYEKEAARELKSGPRMARMYANKRTEELIENMNDKLYLISDAPEILRFIRVYLRDSRAELRSVRFVGDTA